MSRRLLSGKGFSHGGGGGGYTAQGVNFDGTATYLNRGAALTGIADSKVGIFSCWFKMKGGDLAFQMFIEDSTAGVKGPQWLRMNDNTIRIEGAGSTVNAFQASTVGTFATGMGWAHLLCAWDANVPRVQIYINDVSDLAASPTLNNTPVVYTTATDMYVGCRQGTANFLNADIADLYFNIATTLDLSVTGNRRLFISAGGAPVDLGATGSIPTGTAPIMFFHGLVAGWETNDGTGGGFTKNGTLATASSNPP